MKPNTNKTTATTSTTLFSTMQSKIATQPTFNLASAPFAKFPNDNFIDIMTTMGSITEDLDPMNYTLPEAEVGVAIIKASSIEVIIEIKIEVYFIQIEAISDTDVVEDHFKI